MNYYYTIKTNGKNDIASEGIKNLLNIIIYGTDGLIVGCNINGGRSHGPITGIRTTHITDKFKMVFPSSFVINQKDNVDIDLLYQISLEKSLVYLKLYYFTIQKSTEVLEYVINQQKQILLCTNNIIHIY